MLFSVFRGAAAVRERRAMDWGCRSYNIRQEATHYQLEVVTACWILLQVCIHYLQINSWKTSGASHLQTPGVCIHLNHETVQEPPSYSEGAGGQAGDTVHQLRDLVPKPSISFLQISSRAWSLSDANTCFLCIKLIFRSDRCHAGVLLWAKKAGKKIIERELLIQ